MGWAILIALPVAARSQTAAPSPLSFSSTSSAAVTPSVTSPLVGGIPAVDLIMLKGTSPSAPLRFGHVIPGSERVSLDGQVLQAGVDYSMDNAAGVIYLICPNHIGQSLMIDYRYDNTTTAAAAASGSTVGLSSLKFAMGSSLNMFMGLGVAERSAKGNITSSNLVGWNNSFATGFGKLNGVYIIGNRDQQVNSAGLKMDQTAKQSDLDGAAGDSRFLVQNFRSNLLGGTGSVDYQDISQNFTGFGQAKAAGYDDATVKSLTAERGLKRFGYGLTGVKFDGMQFNDTFKDVEDGSKKIEWQTMSMANGGFKLGWSTRRVDQSFTRFNDLSDADKAVVQKEAGLARQDFSGSFTKKTGTLSFSEDSISQSATGDSIDRRLIDWASGPTKFEFGDQKVTTNFNRFSSLLQPEQLTYGREAGLQRQWLTLNSAVMGKGTNLSFNQLNLDSTTGDFRDQTVTYSSKSWNIQHFEKFTETGFTHLGALQDTEIDNDVKQIAAAYDPTIKTSAGDRAGWSVGTGIDRNYTGVQIAPFKNWNANFSAMTLNSTTGKIAMDSATISSKSLQVVYKYENYGQNFLEASNLFGFEQQRIGTLAGLNKTEVSVNYAMSATKKLTFDHMIADTTNGDGGRMTAEYVDKKIDVAYNGRQSGYDFQTAGAIADPESNLFNTIRGYSDQDAHVKWQILPNMKLDSSGSQTRNLTTGLLGEYDNSTFDWAPNKNTELTYLRQDGKNTDPLNALFFSLNQKVLYSESFGKYGKVQMFDQDQAYNVPGAPLTAADSHTEYLSYETKIDALTSLKTEQSVTAYSNGGSQDVDSNTVSRELSKRAGVSVTESMISAKGDNLQDETKRNYGFWYDIGNGLRISYGYNRDLNNPNGSTLNTVVAVGKNADQAQNSQLGKVQQGQLGDVMVGGGYGVNQWDSLTTGPDRVQSFSNLALNTAKPTNAGPFKQVTFKFSMDTASDYAAWLRDNRQADVAGKLGPYTFGVDYRSQMQANGDTGIDRAIKLVSDQDPKKWLRASISYKERTLPGGQDYAIRDFNISAKLNKNLQLSNALQTNPEVVRNDLILGSLPQASRSNKWQLDWLSDPRTTFGASWQELRSDSNDSIARTGGLTAKLFANGASPVSIFYGLQQSDTPGTLRHTTQRYSLDFTQKAGPRQSFSMFLGNLSYDNALDPGQLRNNWTVRLNYQLRL